MAAILCKGIGDCFVAVCNTIGNICILPFKCCNEICKGCGDILQGLCSSPFSFFCFVALISQIPPIIVGFMEINGITTGCKGSLWLLGGILFGIINIIAALYLTIRIGNTNDETLSQYNTSFKRATYLLCHDPYMALYILILLGYFVFLIFGSIWNVSDIYEDDIGCIESNNVDTISQNAQIATACGWFYIFGGSFALACSMCCACCDRRDYSNTTATTTQTPNSPPPPAPNNNNNNNPADDVENPNPGGGGSSSSNYQQQGNFYNIPTNNGGGGQSSTKFNKSGQQQQPQKKNNEYGGGYVPPPPPPAAAAAAAEPTWDTEPSEIPMAYAEAIPEPNNTSARQQQQQQQYGGGGTEPTAPPSYYDTSTSGGGGSTPAAAAKAQQSSAEVENNKGGSIGTAFGRNVGKLFKVDESKQHDLEKKGQQAGEAIGKGFLSAKKFVKSQIDKNNNNNNNNKNSSTNN